MIFMKVLKPGVVHPYFFKRLARQLLYGHGLGDGRNCLATLYAEMHLKNRFKESDLIVVSLQEFLDTHQDTCMAAWNYWGQYKVDIKNRWQARQIKKEVKKSLECLVETQTKKRKM